MRTGDFRIGNLVRFEGKVYEIDVISKEAPFLNTTEFGVGVVTWDDLEPIELNKDLLDSIVNQNSDIMHIYYVKTLNNKFVSLTIICGHRKLTHIRLKELYLHKLQNLIYSLAGQELTINKELL